MDATLLATRTPLRLRFAAAAVRLLGLFASAGLVATTVWIAHDDWGDFVGAAWLAPGAGLASFGFASFALVSLVFVAAGWLARRCEERGVRLAAAGFLLSGAGYTLNAPQPIDAVELLPFALLFTLPALLLQLATRAPRRLAAPWRRASAAR